MMPMVNKYSMVMEKILCTVQIYLFILILSLLKLKFYFKKKEKKNVFHWSGHSNPKLSAQTPLNKEYGYKIRVM